LLLYVAYLTAFQFGMRQFLMPWLKRLGEVQQALTEELGREPTGEEIAQRMGWPTASVLN
jgi:DNA-directed RNA polymerase specialized sigma subunit